MHVSFGREIPKYIEPKYMTKEAKQNTVTIMGSSKSTDAISDYLDICVQTAKTFVLADKNILHGCGADGIMGAAYRAGQKYSKRDEDNRPIQNLAIIATPMWGDEDLENCIPITTASSEAERIEKFAVCSDSFVIFPGSATTIQEASTLIAKNYYGKPEDKKKIVLVGNEFFKGLDEQYQKLYKDKLIKCKPEDLYTIVDTPEEIIEQIKK